MFSSFKQTHTKGLFIVNYEWYFGFLKASIPVAADKTLSLKPFGFPLTWLRDLIPSEGSYQTTPFHVYQLSVLGT